MKRLCADLKVLGRGDLRTLLKWRLKMRAKWRERAEAQQVAREGAPAADGEGGPTAEEEEDSAALAELEALAAAAGAREKSAVRKAKLRLSKQKERLALKMELPGDRYGAAQGWRRAGGIAVWRSGWRARCSAQHWFFSRFP